MLPHLAPVASRLKAKQPTCSPFSRVPPGVLPRTAATWPPKRPQDAPPQLDLSRPGERASKHRKRFPEKVQLKGEMGQTFLTYAAWSHNFEEACLPATLTKPSWVLYQLTHNGASHELLTGPRNISGIKQRGRWITDEGVSRYKKGDRVSQTPQRLSPDGLALALAAARSIGKELQRASACHSKR